MKSGRQLQKNPEEIPQKVLETIKCLLSVPDVKSTLAHTIYYSSYILLNINQKVRNCSDLQKVEKKTWQISHSNRWEIMVKFPQTHPNLGSCCLAIHKENVIQNFRGSQDFGFYFTVRLFEWFWCNHSLRFVKFLVRFRFYSSTVLHEPEWVTINSTTFL